MGRARHTARAPGAWGAGTLAAIDRSPKHAAVHALQRHVLNPGVRRLLVRGVLPPSYAMLETTGRTTGQPRRTPVGNGLADDGFWIVAEHGRRAGYVRNIEADPRVRVLLRDGGPPRWRTGTAEVRPDDDPRATQRRISGRDPGRVLNAFVVRTLGTDLLVVRVLLDDAAA